jgi:hypothetical protein
VLATGLTPHSTSHLNPQPKSLVVPHSSSNQKDFPNLASSAVDKLKGINIVANQEENQEELTLNCYDTSGEKRSNYCHPYIKIHYNF